MKMRKNVGTFSIFPNKSISKNHLYIFLTEIGGGNGKNTFKF